MLNAVVCLAGTHQYEILKVAIMWRVIGALILDGINIGFVGQHEWWAEGPTSELYVSMTMNILTKEFEHAALNKYFIFKLRICVRAATKSI